MTKYGCNYDKKPYMMSLRCTYKQREILRESARKRHTTITGLIMNCVADRMLEKNIIEYEEYKELLKGNV